MEVKLCVLLILLGAVVSQNAENITQDLCGLKETCNECIQTPDCGWCLQLTEGNKHCFHPGPPWPEMCKDRFYYPNNDNDVIEEKTLGKDNSTSANSSSSSSLQFLSPRRISVRLRVNKPYRINVEYTQAEDYPVDLYYLMDLSKSMEDDKEKLSGLGTKLASQMQSITSNFRLGFGSFVDKVVMPFVSTVPEKLAEPCDGCAAPYGFRNHLALTTNATEFSENIRKAAVSGNLDAPEGGFDAIMQAIVCKDEIGWREKARRILVVSTDASFHYAGDGKLGGIVKPNDGLCHMQDGSYTDSTLQDYPSVSQINYRVRQHAINVIFAVTSEQAKAYEGVSRYIEGSTYGILSEDSSNVVELVEEQYRKISSSVEMKDTAPSSVKVTYYSNCLNPDGPLQQTNKCDGVKVGTKVKFAVEFEVKQCPTDTKDWNSKFLIYPVGVNDSLEVDLELICSCP